jgi:hypothetical protein
MGEARQPSSSSPSGLVVVVAVAVVTNGVAPVAVGVA